MTGSSASITVEIITIGDELLLGHTIDTNAAFISRELGNTGFRVTSRCTVGDQEPAIREAIHNALERAAIVICTGGLGPTQDDLTRSAVASLFNVPLDVSQELLDSLLERYRLRGIPMPERNVTQAQVPRGARVLPNKRGTAPGLVLARPDGHLCVLLPGVPQELRGLIVEEVIPFLLSVFSVSEGHPVRYRVLRTTGIAESLVAEKVDHLLAAIAPLTLAFLPGNEGTDLRITSWGELPVGPADQALANAAHCIRDVLHSHIYGEARDDLALVVGNALRERGCRLTVAESCTGGLLGKRLSDPAGASDYFAGGVIAYSNELKQRLLGVSEETLRVHGAVSDATVREMVLGAQRLNGADAALAITGIAGPGGGTPDKPVGTVWVAAVLRDTLETRRLVLPGDREEIRERSAQACLALLWKMLRTTESLLQTSAPTLEKL